jgi:putative ABC transport system ATP-binding protein
MNSSTDKASEPSLEAPTKPLIELVNVSKTYWLGEVEVPALREISLSIQGSEFLVVLGPSGSGKTTLLNLLGGLDNATKGHVIIEETDIAGFNEKQLTLYRRNKIGFVFQFFNLIPTLTAQENVEFALELVSKNGKRAKELLKLVGLAERANHFPGHLSAGEQQRVAIARALAKDPLLLLCDEPTGNLDYKTGIHILGVLRKLNKSEEKTVVVVTHNTAISRMADRVVHLRDGQIAQIITNEHPVEADKIKW